MIKKLLFGLITVITILISSLNIKIFTVAEKNKPIISIENILLPAIAQTEWCENGMKNYDEHYYWSWSCLCERCECVPDDQDCCTC